MYMIPYVFNDFASPFERLFQEFDFKPSTKGIMATDVSETENEIKIEMDLPGVDKSNINIELEDGYLTVSASNNSSVEETKNNGNYIRRERKSGKYKRSFFVGKTLTQEQVKARFANGMLTLTLPKENKQIENQKKIINIED